MCGKIQLYQKKRKYNCETQDTWFAQPEVLFDLEQQITNKLYNIDNAMFCSSVFENFRNLCKNPQQFQSIDYSTG